MPGEKILLYSPEITPRLSYIAVHLASGMLGAKLMFTRNLGNARSSGFPLINYSDSRVPEAVNIVPHGLLAEVGVRPLDATPVSRDGINVLFPAAEDSDTGFDVFAASFYMISRYEEYLPFRKDEHGRFPFGESMACKHSLAKQPLVDLWAGKLREAISRKYPGASFPEREFSFIPTIDIDIPWAYRHRGFWRTAGGVARSVLRADLADMGSRFRVLVRGEADPYDTFGLMEKIHAESGVSPVFFLSAGAYGRFDKCASPGNPYFRSLISEISDKHKWGIHPSYLSYGDDKQLNKEIDLLAGITGRAPVRSRQHYLRFGFPETCRMLADNGITEDYTVGWAETIGFRAGTCTPFDFYDLEREEATGLRIFPFQIMDGTLCDYMGLTPEQASGHALEIVRQVRDVKGTLITLWHNESLSGAGRWKNWEKVYTDIIKAATS